METGYTIRRIQWDVYEITMNGESVLVKRGQVVEGCPRCWHMIDDTYAAIKAAHGVSKARSISSS
jgi:hypothetical protein